MAKSQISPDTDILDKGEKDSVISVPAGAQVLAGDGAFGYDQGEFLKNVVERTLCEQGGSVLQGKTWRELKYFYDLVNASVCYSYCAQEN